MNTLMGKWEKDFLSTKAHVQEFRVREKTLSHCLMTAFITGKYIHTADIQQIKL